MPAVTCPFCNAVVEVQPTDERIDCPRCGERFDPRTAETSTTPTADLPPAASSSAVVRPPGFLYSRAAGIGSFALAAVILIVGLSITRPWEAKRLPPQVVNKLPVVVSPLGLDGLRYLPATTNIVVGFQPMPLLAYAARTKTDPKKFLREAGIPDTFFATLDKTGLPWDQIEHVVVGVAVKSEAGAVLPGLTAVLKLTRPLTDEGKFLTAVRAEKNSQQSQGRTVYSTGLNGLLLTVVDPQTYVFGLSATDLTSVAAPADLGGGHLAKDLREALTTKVLPSSFVWLGTDSTAWADKPSVKLLATLPDFAPTAAKIAAGRAVAAGLAMEPDPVLRLSVRLADRSVEPAVREALRAAFPMPGPTFAEADGWITADGPFATNELKTLLDQLRPKR